MKSKYEYASLKQSEAKQNKKLYKFSANNWKSFYVLVMNRTHQFFAALYILFITSLND